MTARGAPFRLGPNSGVVADVRAALAQGPWRPFEVWKRVNCWTNGTVRQALQDLVKLGDAAHEGPDGRRIYRAAEGPERKEGL